VRQFEFVPFGNASPSFGSSCRRERLGSDGRAPRRRERRLGEWSHGTREEVLTDPPLREALLRLIAVWDEFSPSWNPSTPCGRRVRRTRT
jgi:hypothetical protein